MRFAPTLKLVIVAAAHLLFCTTPGSAQNQGLVIRDGSLGSGPLEVGPGVDPLGQPADYLITPDLGEQHGGNLFHSFESFGIGTSETATFTGPDPVGGPQSVENVISRVTGGEASDLDGTLRSTIPGADVYLLNPAGLMFGPNAHLDVQASFYATTADELRFPNGERFAARAGGAVPVLTVAAPSAWGFLSEPSGIGVRQQTGARPLLEVPEGQTLSLVGGSIDVNGPGFNRFPTLGAESGRIELVSLAAAGELRREGRGRDASLELPDEAELGPIVQRGGRMDASGDGVRGTPNGTVVIRAGSLAVLESADVLARNRGSEPGAPLALDLEVTNDLEVRDSTLIASSDGQAPTGDVRIRAGEFELMRDTSDTGILAGAFGAPSAGVSIAAGRMEVAGGARVVTETSGPGPAGTIRVEADALQMRDRSTLSAASYGSGAAGTIEIEAGDVDLEGPGFQVRTIDAHGEGAGDGGHVAILADRLEARGGVRILSNINGSGETGQAGSVYVDSDVFVLEDSLLEAKGGERLAGAIDVRARKIEIRSVRDFAGITAAGPPRPEGGVRVVGQEVDVSGSRASISANPGNGLLRDLDQVEVELRIDADHLELHDGGSVSLRVFDDRNGGNLRIHAGKLLIDGNPGDLTGVFGDTFGSGTGSAVEITAETIQMADAGLISADSYSSGRAGSIEIVADSIDVRASRIVAQSLTASGGAAGVIELRAPEIALDEGTFVSSSTLLNLQGAGDIRIVGAERVTVQGGAMLTASSVGGNAGSVTIEASESVRIEGGTPLDLVQFLTTGQPGPSGVFAATGVLGAGDSGRVSISAPRVELRDGGTVATVTVGPTPAGDIVIEADQIVVAGGAFLDTSSAAVSAEVVGAFLASDAGQSLPLTVRVLVGLLPFVVPGDAGSITLDARESILVGGTSPQGDPSRIRSATTEIGNTGHIRLSAPDIVIDGGAIATIPFPRGVSGSAGRIEVEADRLSVANGGRIDSSSFDGRGGEIQATAGDWIRVAGSRSGIFARTTGAGEGGAIDLSAPEIGISDGGTVSSESSPDLAPVRAIFRDVIAAGMLPEIPPSSGATGEAGRVSVHAKRFSLTGGSLTTNALGSGLGGTIEIETDTLELGQAASIAARSSGSGDAGSIRIVATDHVTVDEAAISTESILADGGDIEIQAREHVRLDGGEITATVGGGPQTVGGNISVDPVLVVLDRGSRIVAEAEEGMGGSISIRADALLASPDSVVSASSRLGVSGTVDVHAPDVDLSGQLTSLPGSFLDASARIREQCAARRSGEAAGSFAVQGNRVAPGPDGVLSASLTTSAEIAEVRNEAQDVALIQESQPSLFDDPAALGPAALFTCGGPDPRRFLEKAISE